MGLAGAESCCAFYNRKESNRIKDNASDFGHKRGSSQELQMSFVVLRSVKRAFSQGLRAYVLKAWVRVH
jgi:hypothetical protein